MGFQEGATIRNAGEYSTIGDAPESWITSVKVDLTRNTGKVLQGLQDEAEFAIPNSLGLKDDEEWTEIPIYPRILRIVALLSGRVFVGDLCRDEEWIKTTIQYTVAAFKTGQALVKTPAGFLRRLKAPFTPELQELRSHQAIGTHLLK